MRILVHPRDLELGGSSINAVDLATAMRDLGHDPVVVGRRGPLERRLTERGLPYVPLSDSETVRPSWRAVAELRSAARFNGADLVHTFEFWPCVEAFYGVTVTGGVPLLATVMSMELAPYLPRTVALTAGYRDLVQEAARRQDAPVHLLEPPVDARADDMSAVDPAQLLDRYASADGVFRVVLVSRIAQHLKLESIERSMSAVARLAADGVPVRLLVVGGGRALPQVRALATAHNDRLGQPVVVLTGSMNDPRPAYAAADVVVGMGSSAIRGLAFSKPVVVVGEDGFCLPVGQDTMAVFDRTGFYGKGSGRPPEDRDRLADHIGALLADPTRRQALGRFGRDLVERRFALEAVAKNLDRVYADTVARGPGGPWGRVGDAGRTAWRVGRHKTGPGSRLRKGLDRFGVRPRVR